MNRSSLSSEQASSRHHHSHRQSHAGGRWRRRRHRGGGSSRGPVGTEAVALANLTKNAKHFDYPEGGFVDKIEHSLLYNMLSSPEVYPEEVVKNAIDEEDFNRYLYLAQTSSFSATVVAAAASLKSASGDSGDAGGEGEQEEEEGPVSYAQLSALLALSAEKCPSTSKSEGTASNADDSSHAGPPKNSIPQALCKKVLQTVVKYAEKHDLDRQAEVQELLAPVEKHATKRSNKAALHQVLPFYIGYTASIVTANPLPMLVGAAVMSAKEDEMQDEHRNVDAFASETSRRGDVEKTSLLDEADDV